MAITGEDHLVSPHLVVHVQHRGHGSRARDAVGAASPRRSRGESLEGRGGSSSGNRSHHHHAHSFATSRSAAGYSRSSSTSSDEDFWPHRTSPSSSSTNIHNPGSGGSRGISSIGSGSSSSSTHTSLRLAFQGRGGNRRGERVDAVGGDQNADGWGGGRGGDNNNHGHRRSSLFLSLVDSEGPSRSRSIQHCLEAPEASFGAMLPGVEVARRRRVRLAETYDGSGGGFGGGGQEAGQSSRSSRSSGVTVAHHHHYHHHHHHHHVHHQAARHPSRPGTPRPGSLVRRMQDILQEHRARSPFQQVSSSSSSSSTDRTIPMETNSSPQSSSHRSSRGHGHRVGEGESRMAPLSSLWRRQTSSSSSNLRGAALEARNRLDERLRAAAHANHHSRRSWEAVQSSYDMNLLFSDEEEDNFWSDDDGGETSLNEWLAVWAPAAWAPSSVEERWNRVESAGSARASSSRNPTFKPRPSEGLSKAAINALPRQVVGSSRTQGGGSSRNKMEQEDCPVCLEGFLQGQSLMTLPCNHRFHPECLTPWLTNHGQCPYCRADVVKDIDTSSEHKSTSRLMGGSDEELLSWVEAIERGMDRLSYS